MIRWRVQGGIVAITVSPDSVARYTKCTCSTAPNGLLCASNPNLNHLSGTLFRY